VTRGGHAAWAMLAALAAVRAAAAFVPSMWGWGADALRFTAPIPGWSAWAVAALALIPALSRLLVPALERWGRSIDRAPRLAATAAALGSAALVLLLPDRTWLTGDFLWRQINLEGGASFGALYPQAPPLDHLLHGAVARALVHDLKLDPADAGRALGALAALLWGAAAVDAARAFELRGAAAGACAGAVLAGGALLLMTGLNKSYAELMPLAVLTCAGAARVMKTGSGFAALGAWLAAALLAHRSALALIPGAALAMAWGWRAGAPAEGAAARARRDRALGVALPALAALAVIPSVLRAAASVDRAHFALTGGLGGWIGLQRLLDLGNALLLAVPLAALALVLTPRAIRSAPRDARLLAAMGAPLVLGTLLVHPAHGVFRDTDVFEPGGVMLELWAAWALGRTLLDEPRLAWLGVAAVLAAASATLTWLVHFGDVDRGIARVEAFVAEPPARDTAALAGAWDFLGFRRLDLGRTAEAASAFEHAAELVPTPRVLREWASVELRRGDWSAVVAIWERLLARDPANVAAWSEWASLAARNGDFARARAAADTVLRLDPGNRFALGIRAALARDSTAATRPP